MERREVLTPRTGNGYAGPVHAFLLAAALAGARAADCGTSFDPVYERDWGIRREDWAAACALGYDQAEALRALQKKSVEQCAERFLKPAKDKKMGETSVRSLCAQGAAGRAKLIELTAPPAPPKPSAAPKPADAMSEVPSGLGPIHDALGAARTEWKPDACLALLTYHWQEHAKQDSGIRYAFYSKQSWRSSWVYTSFHQPPEGRQEPKRTPNHCLNTVEVQVDLPAALERAGKNGVATWAASEVTAELSFMTADVAAANAPLSGVGRALANRLKGKTFWNIRVRPRGSERDSGILLDASTGEMLHQGAAVHLHLVASEAPKLER